MQISRPINMIKFFTVNVHLKKKLTCDAIEV